VWESGSGQSGSCQPESPATKKGEATMKSARTLITICLLFTAATLFAQIENRPLMKINIPFSFTVDNQTLPAGVYFVKAVTPEHSISLTSADRKHATIVNDLPNYAGAPSENSRLVFHKYGNEYFLTQVWTKGESVARNPYVSKRAIEIAQSGVHPDTEIVLASLGR
jgi:hypothetical protein